MGIISRICNREGVSVYELNEEMAEILKLKCSEHNGAAVTFNGEKMIFIGETGGINEDRLIALHELAHHLFGHLDSEWKPFHEEEARLFAAVFLALILFEENREEEARRDEG